MQPQTEEKKIVNLDAFAAKIAALEQARRSAAELAAFIEGLEAEIKEAMGEATEATVYGVPMFTYQPKSAYAWRKFQDAYPHVARNYMKPVEKMELDKDKLLAEQGDLMADFQTREFRWVNKKPGA